MQKLLGDGTFGRVLRCGDPRGEDVAVKVIKGIKRYREHAELEAETLTEARKLLEAQGCTKPLRLFCDLLGSFAHGDHYCLVFEPLATSLRDVLKSNCSRGLLLDDVREMSAQMLDGLAALHSIGLAHTDLKCRNVMLRSADADVVPHPRCPGHTSLKLRCRDVVLIDFGGAVFRDEWSSGHIGTRQFRAPEAVLGLDWTEKADLWSTGCIVGMLYLGERIFSVHEDLEHLAMMQRVLEQPFPASLSRAAIEADEVEGVAFEGSRLRVEDLDEEAEERVAELEPLSRRVLPRHAAFLDLLLGLLRMDPRVRLGASTGREHAFFQGFIEE